MARKKTTGYEAQNLRRKGQRRIERLQDLISNDNTTERVRNWATRQVKEITSAMQGTRQYSKSGKRYKSKTESYIKGQISRLEAAISEVVLMRSAPVDTFAVTQSELNRASVRAPSSYTKTEASMFYRATQKIWQTQGVGEHSRNEAIMDYFNSIRSQNGLSPLSLSEIVDYVLEANKRMGAMQDLEPQEKLSEEQEKLYNEAQQADNDDSDKGSPSSAIGQAVVTAIQDALEDLFTFPDPTDFDPQDFMDI